MSFLIECRKGYVQLPECILHYKFPLSFGSRQSATKFPSKLFAQKSMKALKLNEFPYWGHIEEMEEE